MKIIQGDCLEKLKDIENNSIDSIVTDPPYELGFMGKKWDNTGIANNVELWKECFRVLKPGGNLLAFSGTRTYHRMASAIEDAGFEVRDMIEWIYGSGFPKSLNLGKAVDKLHGNEREVVGENPNYRPISGKNGYLGESNFRQTDGMSISTKGTSEWEGWGTALKPAHEPICMARKPLAEKTVALNCLKWGTGGINIDESRVEASNTKELYTKPTEYKNISPSAGMNASKTRGSVTDDYLKGRFPANLIHDGSEEVRECFPESKSGARKAGFSNKDNGYNASSYEMRVHWDKDVPAEKGNASRFFKSIIYKSKASKHERGLSNNHPTVKPIALMEYLIKMVTPKGGTVLDPFMGSGSTGVAARNNGYNFIGIEKEEEYFKIAKNRINESN